MRVEQLGEGDPEVAVVGGIHGDEPCGPRAIASLLAESPDVERPVKLIVANEEAIAGDRRYVEEDLNRAFPGDPDGDTHEARLAHDLLREIRDCTVFSLHSTQSYPRPFALVGEVDGFARSLCPYLSIDAVVETAGFSEGRLIAYPDDVIEVECGLQGTERAAENARRLVSEFLVAAGVLSGDREPQTDREPHLDRESPLARESHLDSEPRPDRESRLESESDIDHGPHLDHEYRFDREVPVFRLQWQIPKIVGREYEVFAHNFERVAAGDVYAAADGEEFVADEPFYPILMSPYGYEDVFGYAGELAGRLDTGSPA